ncbi:MAG: acyltransferase [Pseudobacteriovorax sp.]|nr:acyltransferase [Pseudobacteriovorax sp.]
MIRRRELPAISGIRLLAILQLVILHSVAHHRVVFGNTGFFDSLPAPLNGLLLSGPTATGLFFILSGFILTYVYYDEGKRDIRIPFRQFFLNRVSRIYPLHILMLVFLAAILGFSGSFQDWLINAILAQTVVPTTINSWNTPAWAASTMVVFYIFFPILLRNLARIPGSFFGILGLLLFAINLGLCGLFLEHFEAYGSEIRKTIILWFYYSPVIWIAYFVSGILAGLFFIGHMELKKQWIWVILGTAVALFYGFSLTKVSATPHVFMRHSLMLPSQVLLVLTLAYGHGILADICKRPIMVRLSKASFTMYLLHSPLLTVFVPLFKGYGELPVWGFFSFILLLLACSLVLEDHFVEPIRRFIMSRLGYGRSSAKKDSSIMTPNLEEIRARVVHRNPV